MDSFAEIRLLRIASVCEITQLSKSQIYAMVKEGEFPAPVKLGKRAVAWRAPDIRDWNDSRPTTRILEGA